MFKHLIKYLIITSMVLLGWGTPAWAACNAVGTNCEPIQTGWAHVQTGAGSEHANSYRVGVAATSYDSDDTYSSIDKTVDWITATGEFSINATIHIGTPDASTTHSPLRLYGGATFSHTNTAKSLDLIIDGGSGSGPWLEVRRDGVILTESNDGITNSLTASTVTTYYVTYYRDVTNEGVEIFSDPARTTSLGNFYNTAGTNNYRWMLYTESTVNHNSGTAVIDDWVEDIEVLSPTIDSWQYDLAPNDAVDNHLHLSGDAAYSTTYAKHGIGSLYIPTQSDDWGYILDDAEIEPAEILVCGQYRTTTMGTSDFFVLKNAAYRFWWTTANTGRGSGWTTSWKNTANSSVARATTVFRHACVAYANNLTSAWVNNGRRDVSSVGTVPNNDNSLIIGQGGPGYYDDFRVWDVTNLSNTSIRNIVTNDYNSGSGTDCSTAPSQSLLNVCYDFEVPADTTAPTWGTSSANAGAQSVTAVNTGSISVDVGNGTRADEVGGSGLHATRTYYTTVVGTPTGSDVDRGTASFVDDTTNPATVDPVVVTGLSAGTQYCFEVTVRDLAGNEENTNTTVEKCATTNTPPPVPVDFAAGVQYGGKLWALAGDATVGGSVTFANGGWEVTNGTGTVTADGICNLVTAETFWQLKTFDAIQNAPGTSTITYAYRTHATDVTLAAWSSELSLVALQGQADTATGQGCFQVRATLSSGVGETAHVGRMRIGMTPYYLPADDSWDTFIASGADSANNYGITTAKAVGYDQGTLKTSKYLFGFPNHLIPQDGLTGASLCMPLSLTTWPDSAVMEVYQVLGAANDPGNVWLEGTKDGTAGSINEPGWNNRLGGLPWLGGVSNPGLSLADTDYDSVPLATFVPADGLTCVDIPIATLQGFATGGNNFGFLVAYDDDAPTTATHVTTINSTEHSTNPAYLKLSYALSGNGDDAFRVVSNYGQQRSTGVHQLYKVATMGDGSPSIMTTDLETDFAVFHTHYSGLWERFRHSAKIYGSYLRNPDNGNLMLIGGSGASTCAPPVETPGLYYDDPTAWGVPVQISATNAVVAKSASGVNDSNGDVYMVTSRFLGCGVTNNNTVDLYKRTSVGSWTFQKTLFSFSQKAFVGQDNSSNDNMGFDYPSIDIFGANGGVCVVWSSAVDGGWYDGDSCLFTLNGFTDVRDASGTIVTTPRHLYHQDRITDQPGHHVEGGYGNALSRTSNGNYVVLHEHYGDDGVLGAVRTDNLTSKTDNDLKFGGGTGVERVRQTVSYSGANAVGRARFRFKKVGTPTGAVTLSVTFDDTPNGQGLWRWARDQVYDIAAEFTASFATRAFHFLEKPAGNYEFEITKWPIETPIAKPGCEGSITDWTATASGTSFITTGATLSAETVIFDTGTQSCRVDTTASGEGIEQTITGGDWQAGAEYPFAAWLRDDGTGLTATIHCGDPAVDFTTNTLALTTSFQKVQCDWPVDTDIATARMAITVNGAGTFYADTMSPSDLDNYLVIATTGANDYGGGTLETHNGALWTDQFVDAVFDTHAFSDGTALSNTSLLAGGAWQLTTPPIERLISGNLIRVSTGRLFYIGVDTITGNLKLVQSDDDGLSWQGLKNLTTDLSAYCAPCYWYVGRSRSIGTKAAVIAQKRYTGTPGTFGDGTAIVFMNLQLIEAIRKEKLINSYINNGINPRIN